MTELSQYSTLSVRIPKGQKKQFIKWLGDHYIGNDTSEQFRNHISRVLTGDSQKNPLPSEETLSQIPCLLRVNMKGSLYCGRHAPNFKEVLDIELCQACPHRTTKEGVIFQKATGKKPSPLGERTKLAKNDPDRRYCKRDRQWFFLGSKDCLNACKWGTSECPVKRELRKYH